MTAIVADIGATNARFALVSGDEPGAALDHIIILPCADYKSLADAVAAYLKKIPSAARPNRATIAVAGPTIGDHIELTNLHWSFSIAETRSALGFDQFFVINDLTAVSLSLRVLSPETMLPIGRFSVASHMPHARSLGVVAPGTGLGIGGLLQEGDVSLPLSSEGGHVSFAPVDDTDVAILRYLHARYGHVSNERLVCGPGLVNIHEALAAIAGRESSALDPEEITARALSGSDEICRTALTRFCAILGSVAGDLALTLYADAIFIGGGIVPRIVEFLRASPLRARFEAKGRFRERLSQIPTFVIGDPQAGLRGAAVHIVRHS